MCDYMQRLFSRVLVGARSDSMQDHHRAVSALLRPPIDWKRPRVPPGWGGLTLMYGRQTSVSTQLGGRPAIVFSGDVSRGVVRHSFWVGIIFYYTILQSYILAAWQHRLQLVHKIIFRDWFWEGIYTDIPPSLHPWTYHRHGNTPRGARHWRACYSSKFAQKRSLTSSLLQTSYQFRRKIVPCSSRWWTQDRRSVTWTTVQVLGRVTCLRSLQSIERGAILVLDLAHSWMPSTQSWRLSAEAPLLLQWRRVYAVRCKQEEKSVISSNFAMKRIDEHKKQTSSAMAKTSDYIEMIRSLVRITAVRYYVFIKPRLHDTTCCQPVVSRIQTFNRLSNPFGNRFDNRLYRVYSRLSNQLYNPVWQSDERTVAVRSIRLSKRLSIRLFWQPLWQPVGCCQSGCTTVLTTGCIV